MEHAKLADVPMPQNLAPVGNVMAFTIAGALFLTGLMVWWLVSERRRGFILPLLLIGTALSAVLVEPIFDNTLLYWYPVDGAGSAFTAYDRSVPWWLVLGYGWFFGGISYMLWRLFSRGIDRTQFIVAVTTFVVIDQVANGIAGWMRISGFYGPQPFMWGPVNVWFGIADSTAVVVGATVVYVLAPRLTGLRTLWLLVLPTLWYGAVLGGVTSPVTLGLHSDWSTAGRWLGGAGTIALAFVVLYGCYYIVVRRDTHDVLGDRPGAEPAVSGSR